MLCHFAQRSKLYILYKYITDISQEQPRAKDHVVSQRTDLKSYSWILYNLEQKLSKIFFYIRDTRFQ